MPTRTHRVARRFGALSFEALIAFFAILAGISQLFGTSPDGFVEQATSGPWNEIWAASYVIAGIIVLLGVGSGSVALEGAGVTWLAGGILINAVAIVVIAGPQILPMLPTFTASFLACIARVLYLLRGLDVTLVRRARPPR